MNCQTWELLQDGEYNPYNLPTIAFSAGESQTWVFALYRQSGTHFDSADECLIEFAMSNHIARNYDGTPEVYFSNEQPSENGSTIEALYDGEGLSHEFQVKLSPKDTIDLEGKYIYQIYISDADGNSEPLGQGVIYISYNLLRGMKSGS